VWPVAVGSVRIERLFGRVGGEDGGGQGGGGKGKERRYALRVMEQFRLFYVFFVFCWVEYEYRTSF
jgi:hypothetical protein